jgi:hypothetical protein
MVALALLTVMLAGCAGDRDGTAATPTPTGTSVSAGMPSVGSPGVTPTTAAAPGQTTPGLKWTTGPVVRPPQVSVPPVPMLVDIRTAAHPGFDRIVFEFQGQLPGYDIRYVSQVIEDGSGETVQMPGRRFLLIRFEPTNAHDEAGHGTAPRSATVNLPMLRAYRMVGDFEAVVSVALGLDDTVGFRVGELSGPNRVYLDVAA